VRQGLDVTCAHVDQTLLRQVHFFVVVQVFEDGLESAEGFGASGNQGQYFRAACSMIKKIDPVWDNLLVRHSLYDGSSQETPRANDA